MFSRYLSSSSSSSSSCFPTIAGITVLLLLLASPPPTLAKRFDCQMFCRTTGFSGMVGGCRCSFTLFTAKRAVRDHNSVPGAPDAYYEGAEMPEGRDYSLTDLLRLTRDTHSIEDAPNTAVNAVAAAVTSTTSQVLPPKHHPARLLADPTPRPVAAHAPTRLSRSPAPQVLSKRKEFEQDLDNGDTSDYLRLPY